MNAASPETGAPLSFGERGRVLSVNPPAEPAQRHASRQGLVEYLIVVAFVAIAIVGAVAVFGDEIRAALGAPPVRPSP